MVFLLLFAFVSGLVTIAAPCIWPLLPIVLTSSATGGKTKPLGVTLGIVLSFAFFTLTLSYIVKIIPFDPNVLRLLAVTVIGFFGLSLIIPSLNAKVEGWVSQLGNQIRPVGSQKDNGFVSGLITGLSLGIVWSPCAGPILATIATLSATRTVNVGIVAVTLVYVLGVGLPLLILTTFGNRIFQKTRGFGKHTGQVQQIFGVIMIVTAILIFTNWDKVIEARLLNYFPSYSNFLTSLESNQVVTQGLNNLKGKGHVNIQNKVNQPMPPLGNSLPILGRAPDFAGIDNWLNSKPLTIGELKGKVVLVDFWTYTCINCIRTLPHVTSWYEKYKNKGFVVVGVHTPEFEFEKKTANVQDAIYRFGIHYPVAQDNEYVTWNAYNNQYWPAEYLIDAKGNIRRTHFGEGEYDIQEQAIKDLLVEAGQTVDNSFNQIADQTPHGLITPETYVGSARADRQSTGNSPPLHYFSLVGNWNVQPEFVKASKGAQLLLHFSAQHVYLVIHPAKTGDTVKLFLDDKPISMDQAGKDVANGIVTLDTDRLYDLVNLKSQEEHVLKLEFEHDGIECFAFTFG